MKKRILFPIVTGIFAVCIIFPASVVQATVVRWGNIGADMNDPENWTNNGGTPYTEFPTVTELGFYAHAVIQPTLTADMTVGRILFNSNNANGYHFGGSGFTLAIDMGGSTDAITNGSGSNGNVTVFDVGIQLNYEGEVTLSSSTGSLTFNKAITGSSVTNLNLTGNSNGTFYLNVANSYSGTTSITHPATVWLGHHQALSTGDVIVNTSNTSSTNSKLVASTNLTGDNKIANNFILSLLGSNRSLQFNSGSDLELGGTIALGDAMRTLDNRNATGMITLSGAIFGDAGTGLAIYAQHADSVTRLNAVNTFSGNLILYGAGSVQFDKGSNLGAGSTLEFGSSVSGTTTPTLTYLGTGEVIAKAITLAGRTGGVVLDQSGTGLLKFTSDISVPGVADVNNRKTIYLQGDTAGTGELAGNIGDSLQGTSLATSIIKRGTGTWILSGTNNTYTGTTNIEAGTLFVNGALSGSGDVTVRSGSRLGGGGVIAGNTTIYTGAALVAGGDEGSLTFNNNLTFQSDTRFELQTGGGVDVEGNLNLGTNWTLALIGDETTFQVGGEMVIFNYSTLTGSSSMTPAFDLSQLTGLSITPGELALFNDTLNQNIVLQGISSIPEPSGVALVFVSAGLIFCRMRRRS